MCCYSGIYLRFPPRSFDGSLKLVFVFLRQSILFLLPENKHLSQLDPVNWYLEWVCSTKYNSPVNVRLWCISMFSGQIGFSGF